jgi:UDP-N-acetylglucosamine--N-acetylmuramyl-(pentapeptide) pyrophosphoryl-undecaprenol N-acetylglucosamine transferase
MSARVAKVLCAAYPLPQFVSRQVVTGRPVSELFLHGSRERAREELALPQDARVLLAFGGSGGALHLNQAVHEAFGRDADPRVGGQELYVLHVTGRRDFRQFADVGVESDRYRLLDYTDQMPQLLAASDLVISRAGGSVFEIAAVGRAAILVPSPFVTADHQTLNARHFEAGGGAWLVPHAEFTSERARELVEELLSPAGDEQRTHMEHAMRALAKPDAAADIAEQVQRVAKVTQ